jgi:hypothetical protein
MQRADQAARVLGPKTRFCIRREPLNRSKLRPTRSSARTDTEKSKESSYLIQGMCNAIGALRNVQREYLTCVDDEWDHARGDEQRDENRRNRVEAGPAIKLDEERRYDHADGAKRVLLMVSKSKNKKKVKGEDYSLP